MIATGGQRRSLPLPRHARAARPGPRAARSDGTLIVRLRRGRAGRLMRVLLLTGKGGVGKTSLSLATALGAAAHGHRVFVLSTDPAHSLGDALRRRLGPRPVPVAPGVMAQEVAVLEEIDRCWSEIQRWLRGLLRDERGRAGGRGAAHLPRPRRAGGAARDPRGRGHRRLTTSAWWTARPPAPRCACSASPTCCASSCRTSSRSKRRGVRLVRPLLERLQAGSLVPGEETFDAFERLFGDVDAVRADPARRFAHQRAPGREPGARGRGRDAALVRVPVALRRGDGRGAREPRAAGRGDGGLVRALGGARARRARCDRGVVPGAALPGAALRARAARVWTTSRSSRASSTASAIPPSCSRARGRSACASTWAGRGSRSICRAPRRRSSRSRCAATDLLVRVRDATRIVALPGSVAGRAVRRARLESGVLTVDFE